MKVTLKLKDTAKRVKLVMVTIQHDIQRFIHTLEISTNITRKLKTLYTTLSGFVLRKKKTHLKAF